MTYNTAVWESDQTRPFFIYRGNRGHGSSLFKQNYDYVRQHFETLRQRGPAALAETWFERSELIQTRDIYCRSLDNILAEQFPDTPMHFLKIDAQGAESNIIRGASKLLQTSCVGLHLELFTIPLYEGIKLLDEVKQMLQEQDFELVKQFPPHGSFDSQHDCVFLHRHRNPELAALIRRVYGLRCD